MWRRKLVATTKVRLIKWLLSVTESSTANLVQVCSYSLESTEQCDVSDSHPCEVSVQTVTVIGHIKQMW